MTAMPKRENLGRKAGRRTAAATLLGFLLCLATTQAQEPVERIPLLDFFECSTDSRAGAVDWDCISTRNSEWTWASVRFRRGDYSLLGEPIIDPASGFQFPNNQIPQSRLLAHGAWPEAIYNRNRSVFRGDAGRVARLTAEGWTPLHEAVYWGSNSHPLRWLNPAVLDRVLDAWPDALDSGLRNRRWESGRTPLNLAAERARYQPGIVERLLERGADFNARDSNGRTPLLWAFSREAFEALRATGADIHAQDNQGYTVLHRAAFLGDAAAVRELLAAKLDPNAATSAGWTPLHAARSREAFEALRAAGADIRAQPVWGNTVLHRAALLGDAALVRELLAAGFDRNAATGHGWTPLLYASSREAFEALRAAGANVAVIEEAFNPEKLMEATQTSPSGRVQRSVLNGAVVQVGRFLDEAWLPRLRAVNPDFYAVPYNYGRSNVSRFPLSFAAQYNEDPAAIAALIGDASDTLGYNVDATGTTDFIRDGYSPAERPLALAARHNGNPAVVETLLAAGADAGADNGRALYDAALNETPRAAEIVRALLAAGAMADGVEPSDRGRAFRPVYAAAMVQNMATLDALLKAGANVNVEGSTADYSLLADVLSRGRFDCGYGLIAVRLRSAGAPAVRFTESGEVPFTPGPQVAECVPVSVEIQELIDSGADLEAQDERGSTALHRAAAAGRAADIRTLVAAGAEVDAASRGGRLRALHFAVWRRAGLETVMALLEAGADVNARDVRGWTALHWAARDRRVDPALVEALLAAGVEVQARDNINQTALDYATRADIGNEAVAALLRVAGGG